MNLVEQAEMVAHPDGSGRRGPLLPFILLEAWGVPSTPARPQGHSVRSRHHGGVSYGDSSRWTNAQKTRFFAWMAAQEFNVDRPHEAVTLWDRRGYGFFYLVTR